MKSQILGLTLNWELGDFEIKSISAWSHQDDIEIVDDSDGTIYPVSPPAGSAYWGHRAVSRCRFRQFPLSRR